MKLRPLVAVVAAIGILMRVIGPQPVLASADIQARMQLGVPGAVLCHNDDGTGDRDPADTGDCDRCPLCTISLLLPLLSATTAVALLGPSPTVVRQPALVGAPAHSWVPPERANPARAPPAI